VFYGVYFYDTIDGLGLWSSVFVDSIVYAANTVAPTGRGLLRLMGVVLDTYLTFQKSKE
jgi:hypothetical protein